MSNRVLLGAAVKAIREAKAEVREEYRLGKFAATCLLSSAHLCNVEAGRKQPSEAAIQRIAAHLGVPIEAISYIAPEAAAA